MIQGVDLYQGNAFTAASSADFVFLKATQGVTLTDSTFASRWSQLAAMGKVRGAYHYPNIYNTPQADFNHFASVVGPVLRAGDLLALDFEGDTDTHTWAQRTSWKNSFLALAKQRWPGNRVGLYCNLSWWHGTDDNCGDFLWIADYTTAGEPDVVHPWTFQQYSTSGGIDHDVYNGTLAQLKAWAGVPAAAPAPPPSEDDMPVFATGEIKPGFSWDANGNFTNPANVTMVLTPPADAGGLPWGDMYFSLGCDFGTANIRVAVHDGSKWVLVETVTVNDADARLLVAQLPANTGKISLCRVPSSATDTADSVPVAWMVEAGSR